MWEEAETDNNCCYVHLWSFDMCHAQISHCQCVPLDGHFLFVGASQNFPPHFSNNDIVAGEKIYLLSLCVTTPSLVLLQTPFPQSQPPTIQPLMENFGATMLPYPHFRTLSDNRDSSFPFPRPCRTLKEQLKHP